MKLFAIRNELISSIKFQKFKEQLEKREYINYKLTTLDNNIHKFKGQNDLIDNIKNLKLFECENLLLLIIIITTILVVLNIA